MRLTNNIFLNLISKRKSNNSPNKKRISGILFPERIMPAPKIHVANKNKINLKLFLSLK